MTTPAVPTPEPATDLPTTKAPRSKRAWWISGGAAAAVVLMLGTAGVTAVALDDDDDDDDRDDEQVLVVDANLISPDEAAELAVAAVGGGTATDIDLDDEAGRTVYEVEITQNTAGAPAETDVVLDARTGDVLQSVAGD